MVLRTRRHADRVIGVDDGSGDRTAEVAELAGTEVIKHLENKGKGAAVGSKEVRLEPLITFQNIIIIADIFFNAIKYQYVIYWDHVSS